MAFYNKCRADLMAGKRVASFYPAAVRILAFSRARSGTCVRALMKHCKAERLCTENGIQYHTTFWKNFQTNSGYPADVPQSKNWSVSASTLGIQRKLAESAKPAKIFHSEKAVLEAFCCFGFVLKYLPEYTRP
jgi:hypothetical protein